MKKIIFKFLFLFFCAMTIVSCSKDTLEEDVEGYDPVSQDLEEIVYTEIELEVLDKINIYRLELGLEKLVPLTEASQQAEDHTDYMIEVGEVSHDHFPDRFSNLVQTAGAIAVSENVAFGYRSADAVFKAWLNSEAHRDNIVGDYTHFGISIKEDVENRNYFTNIFLKK
ncbi:CAP domain-containing protein [Salegentibacter sp. F188]|uniref:CAP domain-containing protein n=1 Tax=Autumnicola patrickiae TaxID=3075591 RepID=A0ABU3E3W6_9FLAO|nr:CAP domain-containing protein [Salegentibacter sp. F188]MDT0690681.1 CAP domain-containing protein [Salegentibacter sp. F188]